ncbi:MAG: hypothetical protein AB9897_06595 [Anaerolineaceae bacterium]
MKHKNRIAIVFFILFLMVVIIASYAMAAQNTVPVTALENYQATVDVAAIHPECSSYNLVLGTEGNDTNLKGKNGRDNCIFGYAGNDTISGGNKYNIIDGGSGYDTCTGNNKTQFYNCEVVNGVVQ